MFDTLTMNELVALDTEIWRAQMTLQRRYSAPFYSKSQMPRAAWPLMDELGELRQDLNSALFARPRAWVGTGPDLEPSYKMGGPA